MDPERGRRIADLYHYAPTVETVRRPDCLQSAFGHGVVLRVEIEELLGFQAEARSFLETPAMHVLAREVARNSSISRNQKSRGSESFLAFPTRFRPQRLRGRLPGYFLDTTPGGGTYDAGTVFRIKAPHSRSQGVR